MTTIRIENWKLVNRRHMEVSPAFDNEIHFMGSVFGHPQFRDGSVISSSRITGFDGDNFLTESGFVYELGETFDAYEGRYPRARQQLKARLKNAENLNHKEQTAC